jgi:ubiquinone biosynthesis protein UbiJ
MADVCLSEDGLPTTTGEPTMTREQLARRIAECQEDLIRAAKEVQLRAKAMIGDAKESRLPKYSLGTFAAQVDELAHEIKVLNSVLLTTSN